MNLKEAFRYQNFLDETTAAVQRLLGQMSVIQSVTRVHNRKASCASAEDITEPMDKTGIPGADVLVELMLAIVKEKNGITTAIDYAKTGTDLDVMTETNKQRRATADTFRAMLRSRPGKSRSTGTGYTFNNENNQVPYVYEIMVETIDDFDRGHVTKALRTLLTEADQTSSEIDKVLVSTNVNFKPKFDVNDSLEDVLAKMAPEADA